MVTKIVTSGNLGGSTGNDNLTGIAQNGSGQIHAYARDGNDTINLDFARITKYSLGHHARGDGSQAGDDTSIIRGNDVFNFQNLQNVNSVIVGRIEDFDLSRDTLSISGVNITAAQLAAGSGTTDGYSWRIVEFDADAGDSATGTQQWILIDTGLGYVFYALEGARTTSGNGAANCGDQEAHFIGAMGTPQVTAAQLAALPTVGFVDPQNYVPAGFTAQGGVTINDDDNSQTNDVIDISAWGANSIEHLTFNQNGDHQMVVFGDERIELRNFSGTLTESNFIFASSTPPQPNGNNLIHDTTGSSSLIGTCAVDTFVMLADGQKDEIQGFTIDDTLIPILGSANGDLIAAGLNNDNVNAGDGNDVVWGGSGNDTLSGGAGDDTIEGGTGTDVLIGGSGSDTFVGESRQGTDTVQDFILGEDIAVLRYTSSNGSISETSFSTFQEAQQAGINVADISGGVMVSWDIGGNATSLFLAGLNSSDFPKPTGGNLINDTTGRSTLIGSDAADTFVMLADGAKDDIQGFAANDVIDISAWGASSLGGLSFNQNGDHQMVFFGDERIELRNFVGALTESNFIFDGSTPPPPTGGNLINDTTGRSTLIGSDAADTFVMLADGAKDDIQGFAANDVIDISAWGASSLGGLSFNQNGDHQMVFFGDERIELRDFGDTLTESDFIFG